MNLVEIFGLDHWLGGKQSTTFHAPSNFDSWTPLERQCFTSLADALGKGSPMEMRSDYVGSANEFSPKITDLRNYLRGAKSDGGDYLFDSFYALFNRIASDEDELRINCQQEKQLIEQLYDVLKNSGPFFQPQIYATRIRARLDYAKMDVAEPSLEIGIGTARTAQFILSDRRFNVGSDLFIQDLLKAKRNGAPYDRLMAFDMMNIPFSNNTFRSVFSLHSVYHAEDKIAAIREMARVLAPGGTLWFNDISSNVPSERPFVLTLKDFRIFPKSANEFVQSILKPQRYLLPNEYRDILHECGCDEIEIVPSMSLPLYKMVYFFYDLQHLFDLDSSNLSERRAKSLMTFLHSVIAPLLARDHELSEREGAAFWVVRATKRGNPDCEVSSRDLIERTICPACHSKLVTTAEKLMCTSCATEFPMVNGIPILSTAYFKSFNELLSKDQ